MLNTSLLCIALSVNRQAFYCLNLTSTMRMSIIIENTKNKTYGLLVNIFI